MLLTRLGPIEQLQAGKLLRRGLQVVFGLVVYGMSEAMLIRGNLGQTPWDALHLGVARHLALSIGCVIVATSFLVLLFWIPFGEKPGVGTLGNAVVIGSVADVTLRALPHIENLVYRSLLSTGGVLLCAFGSALYIGAQLGMGPRDGLMTGLHRVTGFSLGRIRSGLELLVLTAGLFFGGAGLFGPFTLIFALCIGPLTQKLLPWLIVPIPKTNLSQCLQERLESNESRREAEDQ